MRKTLEVVKHTDSGLVEFRVQGRHVMFLENVSFENARLEAYQYIWKRPQHMWTIRGVVA